MLHLKKRKKKNKAVCMGWGWRGRGLAEHAEDPGYILNATALGLGAQRTSGLVESDP